MRRILIKTFLIGIPCTSISQYPDVDELIGKGLEETKQYFLSQNLHGLIVWGSYAETSLEACNISAKHQKFSSTIFLQSSFAFYDEISNSYHYLFDGRKLCETPIPTYPPQADTSVKYESPPILQITMTIVCIVILVLIILWIVFWVQRVYRRYKESLIEAFANEHTKGARHILFGKYKDEWEVTPKELKIDSSKIIGKGAFGVVYKGFLKKQRNKEWIEMDVAVKFTTEHSTEQLRQDMIEEIGFMKALGSHENLLVMVGYVKSIENPMICTIFCENGDLLGVLRKHPLHFMRKEKCSAVEICLLLPDLLRISLEVCSGLVYLSSLNYVHRDIAARNILLTDQLVAKLSDFGLCKKMEFGEINVVDKEGKFPIKYMPHESLKFGEFSEKSDIWSFGILLFEMFSGGKTPFENLQLEGFANYLEQDGKPIMSEMTPPQLIQLLNEKIFQKYPSRRANFIELKKELCSFYSIVCNVVQKRQ